MSATQTAAKPAAAETAEGADPSWIRLSPRPSRPTPDQAQDLVKNLVEQALAGTVTFDKNLTPHDRPRHRRDRRRAVRAAERDHASTRSS